MLGFVQVDVRSLDAAAVRAPKYEEPLECGQVRETISRARARGRRARRRATTACGRLRRIRLGRELTVAAARDGAIRGRVRERARGARE